jgi:hypothetical protein
VPETAIGFQGGKAMPWTRRWGIIGAIALAQLGIILGYQSLISAGSTAVYAGQAETPPPPLQLPPAVEKPCAPSTPSACLAEQPGGTTAPPLAEEKKEPRPATSDLAIEPPTVPAMAPGPQSPAVGQKPNPTTTPPITLPVMQPEIPVISTPRTLMPLEIPPSLPSPLQGTGAILPVAAQEPVQVPRDPLPTPRAADSIPTPVVPNAQNKKAVPCPWNLSIEMIDGRTHLTAQNGKEAKFAIVCDKLDVRTPEGRIDAAGKVEITSDSLEGTCDHMVISWQEDAVVLDKAQLKCKLQGQGAELYSEQLRLRLNRLVPEPTFTFNEMMFP